MPIRVEHSDQSHEWWSTEAINAFIGASLLILNVQMEMLQIGGVFLMEIILQLPLCMYEL